MNKQIKTALLVVIAAFLSWIGISKLGKFTQEHSAQQLVTETDNVNNNLDLDSLKSNKTKLQKAISRLEKIPSLPELPYQKAQKDLAELRPRLVNIESKLKIEEQSLASLQSALQLDDEATALVKNQSYSRKNWQESKNKWEQAINLLQNIPANTFVSDAAKQVLAACQSNFADVSKGLVKNQAVDYSNSDNTASDSHSSSSSTSSYSGSGSASIYIHPYTRSDGTHIQGHYRSIKGTRVGGFGSFRSGGAHA
ncbi:MAG: hypothetical protein HEQ12_19875 [Aphanizomenon flos-aquae DEX188]|jgi:hypothetical protein|nr:MAG: hypothetical protein HEQ12_19875 [Aphanizomenon flos-aquae DEX188]